MTIIERSGNGADPWCAAAAHPSGWAFAWSERGSVRFLLASGETFSRAVPGDFLRYLDAASNSIGDVAVIGVGHDDVAYLVGSWFPAARPLEKVSGNFPVGVYWDGLRFVPVQVVSATHYTRNREAPQPIPIGQTSQGIRQTMTDGSVVWGDQAHVVNVASRSIHKYQHLAPLWAGQRNGPDHIDLYDGVRWWTPIRGSAQPPRLVQLAQGYAVCAATNHGAVLAVGPPWPALIPDSPEPPPPPPPPQELPMNMPADVYATVVAVVQKFPHTGDDDARRAAMEKVVATVRARHGLRWVWKSEHTTLTPSKDAIAYVPMGTVTHGEQMPMFIWDMIDGTSRQPRPRGDSEPVRHAYVVATEPQDWLTGEPPPPPPPPSDCREWKDKVSALEQDLDSVRVLLGQTQEELVAMMRDRDRLAAEVDRLKHRPCECELSGPGWAIRLLGISCRPKA